MREAAALRGALEAELWGSALLGVLWKRRFDLEPGDFSRGPTMVYGEPLIRAVAGVGGSGAAVALRVIAAVDDGELGMLVGELCAGLAAGSRLPWDRVPAPVRAAVERALGSAVVAARDCPGGFSPGSAARLRLADGRRVFAKAVGREPNPVTPQLHRREAAATAALPPGAPAPRLLHGSCWCSPTWPAPCRGCPGTSGS